MFGKLKTLGAAVAIAALAPVAATAASITGQLSFVGLTTGDGFTGTGVTLPGTATVLVATEDFASVGSSSVDLTSVTFAAPGEIWSFGDFTFFAESFTVNVAETSFDATGYVTDGVDSTDGFLSYSQEANAEIVTFSSTTVSAVPVPAAGLLLLAGVGALGVAGRRKAA